jgi:Zn-dependent alcohol dehydrogenase
VQVALGAKQRGASMIIGVDLNQDKFKIGFRLTIFLSFINKFILELYHLLAIFIP